MVAFEVLHSYSKSQYLEINIIVELLGADLSS